MPNEKKKAKQNQKTNQTKAHTNKQKPQAAW